jgi:hypothetical protein
MLRLHPDFQRATRLCVLTHLIAVLFTPAGAQITLLSNSHEPVPGITFSVKYDSLSNSMLQVTGPGCNWDFSALSRGSSPAQPMTYMTASSTPVFSLFPTATLANQWQDGSYTFYRSTSGSFERLGDASPSGSSSTVYSDPQTLYTWPLSYATNNSFSDSFSYPGNTTTTVNGAVSASVTGYGTLTLPGGIILNNVLQIQWIEYLTYVQTSSSLTNTNITKAYYHSSERYPILTYIFRKNYTGYVSASFMINEIFAVGLKENINDAAFRVFPNPVHDLVTIESLTSANDPFNVTIENLLGMKLLECASGGLDYPVHSIDLSHLSRGICTITISTVSRQEVYRIIVE